MTKMLTSAILKQAAGDFAESLRGAPISDLFGTTDGKALGTWIETRFGDYLAARLSLAVRLTE